MERGATGVPRDARGLSALLADGKSVVLDGALATYLETLGAGTWCFWSFFGFVFSPLFIS